MTTITNEQIALLDKLTNVARFKDTVTVKIDSQHLSDVTTSLGLNLNTCFEMSVSMNEYDSYVTFTAIELLIYARYIKLPITRSLLMIVNSKRIYLNTFVCDKQTFKIINYKGTACFI